MGDDIPPPVDTDIDRSGSDGVTPDAVPNNDSRTFGESEPAAPITGGKSETANTGPETYHASWYRRGTVRREARATLEEQVEHCNDIDAKAMRTFRFGLLLLGLLTPVFTLTVEYGPADGVAAFYNLDVTIGVICLLASSALAGVTYTASSVAIGLSSTAIMDARRRNLTDRATHDTLLDSYATWIQTNDRTIVRNSLLVTATVLLLIYAVVFLALGVTLVLAGPLPTLLRWFAYVALAVLTALSQLL